MRRIVIVGGSLAGLSAASALRAEGHDGSIVLLGDERHAPYARPPLSKGVLTGKEEPTSAQLPPPGDDIDLRLGTSVVTLDFSREAILTRGGAWVPYDGLIVATGARARSLGQGGLQGEYLLRDLDDSIALQQALARGPKVVVVGAGFLGMEVASSCRMLGLEVDVVDIDPPLLRLLGPDLSEFFADVAREDGVRIHAVPDGASLLGDDKVTGVAAAEFRIDADIVVTAVGDVPNTEWLGRLGSHPGFGPLLVDSRGRFAPGIVAAGDVAAFREENGGEFRRTPHWSSAVQQARTAAAALLRGDQADPVRPGDYFWTEQFGLDLRMCGQLPPRGEMQIVDGSLQKREAIVRWIQDGSPTAAATINRKLSLPALRRFSSVPIDSAERQAV